MSNCRFFLICCFTVFFVSVISLENKNGTVSVSSSILNGDSSHEESHSQNVHPKTEKHMVTSKVELVTPSSPHSTTLEPVKKSFINTNKTHVTSNKNATEVHNATHVESVHTIPTEGGTIDVHDSSKPKPTQHIVTGPNKGKDQVSHTNHIQFTYNKTSINSPKVNTNNKTTIVIKEEISTSEKPKYKRIHGRPGVDFGPETLLPVSSSTTPPTTPKAKKPLFTMITGDKESKESESFIESPTTGRDYVLPIVLIILALPIVGYIIKLIYKRGTEFTERQQYHRMYLIDGMYNSR